MPIHFDQTLLNHLMDVSTFIGLVKLFLEYGFYLQCLVVIKTKFYSSDRDDCRFFCIICRNTNSQVREIVFNLFSLTSQIVSQFRLVWLYFCDGHSKRQEFSSLTKFFLQDVTHVLDSYRAKNLIAESSDTS